MFQPTQPAQDCSSYIPHAAHNGVLRGPIKSANILQLSRCPQFGDH